MTRNIGASARARMKTYADEHGEESNLTLTHYGLERLLYRKSASQQPHCPTCDVDLLDFGSSDIALLVDVFRKICEVAVDDGGIFGIDGIKGAEIRRKISLSWPIPEVPAPALRRMLVFSRLKYVRDLI